MTVSPDLSENSQREEMRDGICKHSAPTERPGDQGRRAASAADGSVDFKEGS
jgi:hypothetical protein